MTDFAAPANALNTTEYVAFNIDPNGEFHAYFDHSFPESVTVDAFGEIIDLPDYIKAMHGASNQHGYDGPIMHESETVSAGMIQSLMNRVEDRLTAYVSMAQDEDGEIIGWALLYMD